MTRLRRTFIVAVLAVGVSVATVQPVFAVPNTSMANGGYTVQTGDYLMGIALKLNVKVSDLLAANKMVLTSLILPGQVLVVPGGAHSVAVVPAATKNAVYVVVKNDYLTGIAAALHVPIRSLLTENHLVLNSLIWPGMRLTVPAGGVLPPNAQAKAGSSTTPTTTPTTSTATSTATSTTKSTKTITTTTVPAKANSAPYIVVRGDSLSLIANRLGVRLASLLAVNQLSISSVIYADMKLVVPAGGSRPAASNPTAPTKGASAVPAPVNVVLNYVRAQLGKPYKAFMVGPDSFDCSGLTMAAYREIGIVLPHYSGAQIAFGTAIDWTTEAIRPGDLVFLESAPGSGVISHVGIATSATTWIHSPRTGDVVRTGNIPTSRVVGVRRLVNG